MKKAGKSYLIIDKEEFCKKMKNRLSLGNELLSRQVLSAEALEKFKIELKEWHNYNLELLKQSFNNPENDYKEEYQKSHHGMNFFGSHSLAGDVEDNKKKITNYIRGIEKILNKADLIPILGNAQKQGAN